MTATDRTNLRDKVRIAYSAAAEMPQEKHAFPVGAHLLRASATLRIC